MSDQQANTNPPPRPEPGLYADIQFDVYLGWPLLSQSALKQGRKSMAHLRAAMDESVTPTDPMLLGSALHAAFLEPELMPERVIRYDGGARRGANWEAFKQEHAAKVILTPGMHEKLVGMVRAMRRHPELRRWLGRIEATEVAAVGTVEGVPMKGRCDAMTADGPLLDLKKVADAEPRLFRNSAWDFGHHIQAWVYRELFGRPMILVAVEENPPHDVVFYEPDDGLATAGEREGRRLLGEYRRCVETGAWPGRKPLGSLPLSPPAWAVADEDAEPITLHGQEVAL